MPVREILQKLLRERGITAELEAEFLAPQYEKLHDPNLLPDMELAAARIIAAIRAGEHVVVFSDYDADGIPGAVVLNDFFKRAGYANVSFYIPHRHDEGFGLSTEAIDEALERGAKLLITVDCGVADIDEVKYAVKKGLDVIITDHHEPKAELPPALAIVNPMRHDSKYPFPHLCGSGVAYKLVQGILAQERFGIKEGMEKWSLDMVAIATLSDMVPLVGENRILAKYGLEVMKKSSRPGLQMLCQKLSIDQRYINEDDIAFMITPRINAASRMGVPEDAFKLLATTDPREAAELAAHLEKINNDRKVLVATIVKDAKKHLKQRDDIPAVIVIGNPEWRPAILGLVANSLVEEYSRPAFVWGRDGDGVLKGSCRSYNGYDLFALMNCVPECFCEFGGHAGAGGFSVTLEQLTTLEEKLSNALETLAGKAVEVKDAVELELSHIGEELWNELSKLAPFGMGNPKPIFKINSEVKDFRQFGKTQDHLEVVLKPNIKAISFFTPVEKYPLSVGTPVNMHAHLEKSYFRGRPELRMRIVDIYQVS